MRPPDSRTIQPERFVELSEAQSESELLSATIDCVRKSSMRSKVERWRRGFEAAAAVGRAQLRKGKPDPEWSIALSLSMIEAAERIGIPAGPDDPVRERGVQQVRRTWAALRRKHPKWRQRNRPGS